MIAVYVMSKHDALSAAEIAQQRQRKRLPLPPAGAYTDWAAAVELWYLAASEAAILALEFPLTKQQRMLREEAIRWLAELRTEAWVRQQTFEVGVAPLFAALAGHYQSDLV